MGHDPWDWSANWSTIYNTNPSSDFLVGEGGEIDDDEIEVEEIIPNDDATTTSHTTATTTTSYNNNNDRTNLMNMNANQNNTNEELSSSPFIHLLKPQMHNKHNEEEILRLREAKVRTENSRAPLVLSPTDITMVESLYFNHQILGQTAKINLTRSLGHCVRKNRSFSLSGSLAQEDELVYATLQKFDVASMDYNPMKDNVEVLVASDGFWDMVADDEIHSLLNEMKAAWRKKQMKNEHDQFLIPEEGTTLNQQEGLTGIEDDVQDGEIVLQEEEEAKRRIAVHESKKRSYKDIVTGN